MLLYRISYLLLAVIFIYGCTPDYSVRSPREVSASTQVQNTDVKNHVLYRGPELSKEDSLGWRSTDQLSYWLIGLGSRDRVGVDYQLLISIWYQSNSWRTYNSANLEDMTRMPLTRIDKDLNCMRGRAQDQCMRKEHVGIALSRDFIEERSNNGFTIQVVSSRGHEHVLFIPPNYVQGYLAAVDADFDPRKVKPSPTDLPPKASKKEPAPSTVDKPAPTPEVPPAKPKVAEAKKTGAAAKQVSAQNQQPEIGSLEDGLEALKRKDYTNAYKILLLRAQRQDAKAQAYLSELYYRGLGVQPDLRKAQHWLSNAAFEGYPPAQFNLGNAYKTGRFGENDPLQAAYWWKQAANQGLVDAQYNLGRLYLDGDGVARSTEEAKAWFRKAAKQGSKDAKDALYEIEKTSAPSKTLAKAPQPNIAQKDADEDIRSWLKRQHSDHYTIQLFASSRLSMAEDYRSKNRSLGGVRVFPFQRANKKLYAVIQGSYPSYSAAKQAVSNLPEAIRKSGVWIRSFGSVLSVVSAD